MNFITKKPAQVASCIAHIASQKQGQCFAFLKWLFFDSNRGVLRYSYFQELVTRAEKTGP